MAERVITIILTALIVIVVLIVLLFCDRPNLCDLLSFRQKQAVSIGENAYDIDFCCGGSFSVTTERNDGCTVQNKASKRDFVKCLVFPSFVTLPNHEVREVTNCVVNGLDSIGELYLPSGSFRIEPNIKVDTLLLLYNPDNQTTAEGAEKLCLHQQTLKIKVPETLAKLYTNLFDRVIGKENYTLKIIGRNICGSKLLKKKHKNNKTMSKTLDLSGFVRNVTNLATSTIDPSSCAKDNLITKIGVFSIFVAFQQGKQGERPYYQLRIEREDAKKIEEPKQSKPACETEELIMSILGMDKIPTADGYYFADRARYDNDSSKILRYLCDDDYSLAKLQADIVAAIAVISYN